LQIKNKEGKKTIFLPNRAQIDFVKNRTGRDIILKARQLGFTTLLQLLKLDRILCEDGITVATIAHRSNKTNDIFQIAKYAWDNLPDSIKQSFQAKYDNVRELYLASTASRYFVDLDVRSMTVQDLHISEMAFIDNVEELLASSLEAVPKDGNITIETTANGLNKFYDLWTEAVQGKNEFKPHFYNWTWDDTYQEQAPKDSEWKEEYKTLARDYDLILDIQPRFDLSDNQFYWYYLKARRLRNIVKQEYPTIAEEAFMSSSKSVFELFKVSQIVPERPIEVFKGVEIYKKPEAGHRYIIGCDTAEGTGGDSTAIEVWDFTNDVKEEVASFLDNTIRPDQTAYLMVELGKLYNDAYLIPERNSSGLTTVLKLQEMNYQKMFVNRQIDTRTQRSKNEYGWRTQGSNRDVMIDDFIELFENNKLIIRSSFIVNQLKTFVRLPNGKRQHDEGYHDDSLFASFLAVQGAKYHREIEILSRRKFGI